MNVSTFENRAKKAGLRKNTVAYRELLALMNNDKSESRPDVSQRRSVRIYTNDMLIFGAAMGIGIGRRNDAPKNGIDGNVCFLTAKGKRQMFNK